jgi:hypothetical protein
MGSAGYGFQPGQPLRERTGFLAMQGGLVDLRCQTFECVQQSSQQLAPIGRLGSQKHFGAVTHISNVLIGSGPQAGL